MKLTHTTAMIAMLIDEGDLTKGDGLSLAKVFDFFISSRKFNSLATSFMNEIRATRKINQINEVKEILAESGIQRSYIESGIIAVYRDLMTAELGLSMLKVRVASTIMTAFMSDFLES
ncbi:MAG: hypothetical protein H7836_04445 [Magnetococcus sp. YQC-3]